MKTSSKFIFLQSRHYGCFAVPYILHSENFNVTVLCHEKHKFYWCWVYNPFTWMGYHLFSIYGLQKRQLLSIYQESFNFHRTNFPIYTNTEEKYPTRLLLNSRFQNNRHIQDKRFKLIMMNFKPFESIQETQQRKICTHMRKLFKHFSNSFSNQSRTLN